MRNLIKIEVVVEPTKEARENKISYNIFVRRILLLFILFFLYSCNKTNYKHKKEFNISFDSVSYIEYEFEKEEGRIFKITNQDSLKIIIGRINRAKLKMSHFGSLNRIRLYDKSNKIIISARFCEDSFRIDGAVFQTDSYIIDESKFLK